MHVDLQLRQQVCLDGLLRPVVPLHVVVVRPWNDRSSTAGAGAHDEAMAVWVSGELAQTNAVHPCGISIAEGTTQQPAPPSRACTRCLRVRLRAAVGVVQAAMLIAHVVRVVDVATAIRRGRASA